MKSAPSFALHVFFSSLFLHFPQESLLRSMPELGEASGVPSMQMAMPARFFQTVDMNSWFENLNDWMVII